MNKVWLLVILISFAFYKPLFAQNVQKTPRYTEKNAEYDRGATYANQPEKLSKRDTGVKRNHPILSSLIRR